jgi:Domain of unknown function (DUF4397)
MFFKPLSALDSAVRLAALAGILGVLSGCQAIVTSAPTSQVRIIDASPDAPSVDMYEGNNALAFNLGFGTLTSYIPMSPGTYTIATNTTGSKQALASGKATFAASTQYTILIGSTLSSLQQLTLTDQSQPAPAGQIALRFIDQATRINAVDIYLVPAGQKLTAVTPLITGAAFGGNTGYLNIPAGTYTLVMLPAGTVPTGTTIPTYTGPQITYAAGSVRTIILIDQQLAIPGLQVITADDVNSAL